MTLFCKSALKEADLVLNVVCVDTDFALAACHCLFGVRQLSNELAEL